MTKALASVDRKILFQICDWGVDFPALWAPSLGNTWRISNDIIPAWRTIFRILNQAVPQTSFAGPGHWPDLDMPEVGNNVFTIAEERTHFSLWAILKSPLTIGAALNDTLTTISESPLQILKQKDAISYNQDPLGVSVSLKRRWTEEGFEVWSEPILGGKTVVALINWADESRNLTLDLPVVGLQHAQTLRNIWDESAGTTNVRTSYSANVAAHGMMLVELAGTTEAGKYPADIFATSDGSVLPSLHSIEKKRGTPTRLARHSTTFEHIYAETTSSQYQLTVVFAPGSSSYSGEITIHTSPGGFKTTAKVQQPSASQISVNISLSAGSSNTITISPPPVISYINITAPSGTYYPCTSIYTFGIGQTRDLRCGILPACRVQNRLYQSNR